MLMFIMRTGTVARAHYSIAAGPLPLPRSREHPFGFPDIDFVLLAPEDIERHVESQQVGGSSGSFSFWLHWAHRELPLHGGGGVSSTHACYVYVSTWLFMRNSRFASLQRPTAASKVHGSGWEPARVKRTLSWILDVFPSWKFAPSVKQVFQTTTGTTSSNPRLTCNWLRCWFNPTAADLSVSGRCSAYRFRFDYGSGRLQCSSLARPVRNKAQSCSSPAPLRAVCRRFRRQSHQNLVAVRERGQRDTRQVVVDPLPRGAVGPSLKAWSPCGTATSRKGDHMKKGESEGFDSEDRSVEEDKSVSQDALGAPPRCPRDVPRLRACLGHLRRLIPRQVDVGRGARRWNLAPFIWGNPFKVNAHARAQCLALHKH